MCLKLEMICSSLAESNDEETEKIEERVSVLRNTLREFFSGMFVPEEVETTEEEWT